MTLWQFIKAIKDKRSDLQVAHKAGHWGTLDLKQFESNTLDWIFMYHDKYTLRVKPKQVVLLEEELESLNQVIR